MENTAIDLVNDLIDKMCKSLIGKNFGKYVFVQDSHSGAYYLESKDLYIYCSPFWEGENGILVSFDNEDGEEYLNFTIEHDYPTNAEEVKQFEAFYTQKITELSVAHN